MNAKPPDEACETNRRPSHYRGQRRADTAPDHLFRDRKNQLLARFLRQSKPSMELQSSRRVAGFHDLFSSTAFFLSRFRSAFLFPEFPKHLKSSAAQCRFYFQTKPEEARESVSEIPSDALKRA